MTTLQEAMALGDDAGVERAFHCHVHENSNTAAASVNVVLGVWICYSCGAAGKTNGKVSRAADVVAMASTMLEEDHTIARSKTWLDMFDAHHPSPYWVERVGYSTAELFRCGTDPATGAPTYPVRNIYNQVLGVVKRMDTPKYVYPAGVSVSRCLFGWEFKHAAGSAAFVPVMLMEGAADVMTVQSRTRVMGLGVYGAGLKMPQIPMVKDVCRLMDKDVLLCFDNDDAGRRATKDSQTMLAEAGIRSQVFPWHEPAFVGKKDIAEVCDDEQSLDQLRQYFDGMSEGIAIKKEKVRRNHAS